MASAGSVPVTATARVDRLVWNMGEGRATCHRPGTQCTADQGKAPSSDCGHRFERPGEYPEIGTARWNIDWTATGGDGGALTESRTTELVADLRETQVLNTRWPGPLIKRGLLRTYREGPGRLGCSARANRRRPC
ncbi:hypothetical protein CH313_26930 [Streptomyces sp. TSRI0384-2]|nr:hypothetical protein CH313_26930 [Streptomyces sp. TSRI0384-2]